jgi:hypothetical protein
MNENPTPLPPLINMQSAASKRGKNSFGCAAAWIWRITVIILLIILLQEIETVIRTIPRHSTFDTYSVRLEQGAEVYLKPSTNLIKYEYKQRIFEVYDSSESTLYRDGNEGWELVSVCSSDSPKYAIAYFKRVQRS